jgi:hypothetical protein
MSYCAICGREHDPDLLCFDGTSQALRRAGADDPRHNSASALRKIVRQADRWLIRLLIALLALIAAIVILSIVLEKKAF